MDDLESLASQPGVPEALRRAALAEVARRTEAERAAGLAEARAAELVAAERDYADRLVRLNEAVLELSRAQSIDELCRRAVELGFGSLDVGRLGVWLLAPDGRHLTGTYGVDEEGAVRDEHGSVVVLTEWSSLREMAAAQRRYMVRRGKLLYDHAHRAVGEGSQVATPLCGIDGAVGMIYADDLLLGRSLTEQDCELISLFAALVGHLVVRIRLDERGRQLEAAHHQSRKLESLRIVAAGVAHDLSNALQAVLGNAELALRGLPADSPLTAAILEIRSSAERSALLARRMRLYAGGAPASLRPCSLEGILVPLARRVRDESGERLRIDEEYDDLLPLVSADPALLEQALFELVTNATEALGGRDGGRITLATGLVRLAEGPPSTHGPDLPAGEWAYVEIRDNGPGIDAASIAEAFDPFYSTRSFGRGLGLPTVQGVARAHGGAATLERAEGGGIAARIYLSVARGAEAATAH